MSNDRGADPRARRCWWRIERHGPIAVATFSLPPRNMMTFAAMTEFEGIVNEVAGDESITILVVASDTPNYFIAHGDLPDLVRLGTGAPLEGDPLSWWRVLGRLSTMPQVVVAAIDGQAWGGGCEFAWACTMRVASPRANFCQPEIALGIIPGGGGTQRLPRLVGSGRATEIILSGRVVPADEALRIGLVEAVLDEERFLDAVLDWLALIASRPPVGLRAAKAAIVQGLDEALDEGLRRESELVSGLLANPESLETMRAAIKRYEETPPETQVVF